MNRRREISNEQTSLVPADFVVPAGFRHKEFVARMLSVRDLVPDYDAVMSTEKESA